MQCMTVVALLMASHFVCRLGLGIPIKTATTNNQQPIS
jgi:hypothetical protein